MKTAALLLALCALGLAFASQASAAEEFERYEVKSAGASLSSNQAGAHADMTISFALSEEEKEHKPFAKTRDIFVSLPPGVIGNPLHDRPAGRRTEKKRMPPRRPARGLRNHPG
jgi:hypothetical protein